MNCNEYLIDYEKHLRGEEKSQATKEKYLRDVRAFLGFCNNREITKSEVLEYKQHLSLSYAPSSANSMIIALNGFLRFIGFSEYTVKPFKIQRQLYCPEEKELTKQEYERLVRTAKEKGNERLNLVIQTICGTGIRVSELKFITVDAVRRGEAVVSLKGKTRSVFIVKELKKKLLRYIAEQKLTEGSVFITHSGKPINRTNIWREMKNLCKEADVSPDKVFPHNLRHLFARIFYKMEKDIAKLADILGHSSIDTTRIYIITTKNEYRRRMENMRLII